MGTSVIVHRSGSGPFCRSAKCDSSGDEDSGKILRIKVLGNTNFILISPKLVDKVNICMLSY
jgi:hypothetical protein